MAMRTLNINSLCLLLYCCIVLLPWSPAVSWLLGVNNKIVFSVLLVAYLLVSAINFRINKVLFLFVLCFLLVSLFLALVGEKLSLFAALLGFPLSLLVTQHFFRLSRVEELVDWFSWFSVVAVVMSCVGLAYSLLGGEAMLAISNHDGRDNFLFLTTFSNAQLGGIIRPSFIYDEPGALSFVLIFTAVIRELSGRPKINTLYLLVMGMVTFSLTHLIILVIYVLVAFRGRSGFTFGVLFIGALVLISLSVDFFKPFVDRVHLFVSGGENNRSIQMANFFDNADVEELFWVGVTDCSDPVVCGQKYGDMTSNPMSVFFGKGVLGLLVQAFFYFFFIFSFVRYRLFFPALAMVVLISQRPFFTAVGYSTMMVFVVFHVLFVQARAVKNDC